MFVPPVHNYWNTSIKLLCSIAIHNVIVILRIYWLFVWACATVDFQEISLLHGKLK